MEFVDEEKEENVPSFDSLQQLMRTERPKVFRIDGDDYAITKSGIVYFGTVTDSGIPDGEPQGAVFDGKNLPPATQKLVKGFKFLVMPSADQDTVSDRLESAISDKDKSRHGIPSISYACLAQLHDGSDDHEGAMLAVAKGSIVVLDFLPDSTIPYTAAEKKLDPRQRKAPMPGYSEASNGWHRAATILLMRTRDKARYIVGFDDGQYFGCELKGKPNTVDEAFKDLVPAVAHNKPGVDRQGEWFIVPVAERAVPKNVPSFTGLTLPKEDRDSNSHEVVADDGEIRVSGMRIYARNFEIEHDQHPAIRGRLSEQWYEIVRNTAVQSVSTEGVD